MDQGERVEDILGAADRFASQRDALVIVDTCRLFREGLANILQASRFNVVMAAARIQEVLAEIDIDRTTTIDMLICSLDPQRGIEAQLMAIEAVRRRNPATKTVLLMPSCSAEDLVAAVLCGADGVVLKDISGEKLIAALDLVMHGQHVLPLGVALQVFTRLRPTGVTRTDTRPGALSPAALSAARPAVVPPTAATPAAVAACASVFGAADAAGARERTPQNPTRNLGLSERETQILRCLIEGCANKLIARRLDIAEATVKVHIKGLLRKINVSNRTQAAIWALNQSVSIGQARHDAAPPFEPAPAIPPDEPPLSDMIAVFPPAASRLDPHALALGSSGLNEE